MRELTLLMIEQSLTEIKLVILGMLHELDVVKIGTRFVCLEKSDSCSHDERLWSSLFCLGNFLKDGLVVAISKIVTGISTG